MPVTIRDLAQQLNLSIATVSRALDNYSDISPKTRQRVQQAAQQMGYTPNRAARQLRRKKADAIGYILPSGTPRFADPFYAEFLVGLSDECALHPFDLLVSNAPPGAQAEQDVYASWVQSRKVDGFVLNRLRHDDWRSRFLYTQGTPFVSLEHDYQEFEYRSVEVDNAGGMLTLVQHLASAGYRRLAYIGGPADLLIQRQRYAGFCQGLEQAGLALDPERVLPGDLTSEAGFQAVKHMRWIPDPPDAIVCVNDETAFGALHALHDLGLKIGQQVGVTGFDGVQAAMHTDPPLTTLDIPVYEIARQLVRLLAAEINHQPTAERLAIQPRLLARASTHRIAPA